MISQTVKRSMAGMGRQAEHEWRMISSTTRMGELIWMKHVWSIDGRRRHRCYHYCYYHCCYCRHYLAPASILLASPSLTSLWRMVAQLRSRPSHRHPRWAVPTVCASAVVSISLPTWVISPIATRVAVRSNRAHDEIADSDQSVPTWVGADETEMEREWKHRRRMASQPIYHHLLTMHATGHTD